MQTPPKPNYQRELERVLQSIPAGKKPILFLHACCAPCSSYVLEYLSRYFTISIYFYNPNIHPQAEYEKRLAQFPKLLQAPFCETVQTLDAPYDPEAFFEAAKGLENEPEGGARCTECFQLRLRQTAKTAKEQGFDYFTTTLTVSPHKNAALLNEIGKALGEKYGVKFLPSDFKKKEGYKRSITLSKDLDLYRQTDCGCSFSKRRPTATPHTREEEN